MSTKGSSGFFLFCLDLELLINNPRARQSFVSFLNKLPGFLKEVKLCLRFWMGFYITKL